MNKLFLITLGTCVFTMFSFNTQTGGGVKKIATDMYEVSKTAKFTKTEQDQIKKILSENYKITDFTKVTKLSPKSMTGGKYNWILNKSAGMNFVEEKFIRWDTKDSKDQKAMQNKTVLDLSNILDKYTTNNPK